jgi:hypothetical protein
MWQAYCMNVRPSPIRYFKCSCDDTAAAAAAQQQQQLVVQIVAAQAAGDSPFGHLAVGLRPHNAETK